MIERDDIEPPSDDLRALFAAERDVSAVERAAIRGKLGATLAAPAPATAAIATTKLAWLAAAVIAAAAGIWWLTRDRAPKPAPVPAPQVAPPAPEPPAPEPTITTTTPEPPPPAPPITATAPEPPPPAPPLPTSTAADEVTALPARRPSQAELLAKAWQALPTDPAGALQLVELDARVHAKGALGEERDALHVQALASLGRHDEARTVATRFVARYPRSVHRKRVEAVLR